MVLLGVLIICLQVVGVLLTWTSVLAWGYTSREVSWKILVTGMLLVFGPFIVERVALETYMYTLQIAYIVCR